MGFLSGRKYREGDKVRAKLSVAWKREWLWHGAKIQHVKVNSNGTYYLVQFDDGSYEFNVKHDWIRLDTKFFDNLDEL